MDSIKKSTSGSAAQRRPMFMVASFDNPNHIARVSGWDLDFRPLQANTHATDVVLRSDGELEILKFTFSGGIHQIGASPADKLTIGIPISGSLTDWQLRSCKEPELLSFGSGEEFDCVSAACFSGITISVDYSAAMALASDLGLPLPDKGFGLFSIEKSSTGRLREIKGAIVALLSVGELDVPKAASQDCIAALLEALTGVDHCSTMENANARARASSRAIELMAGTNEDVLTIAEICAALGVSSRTLERSFLERFGIGPKSYYTRMRLERVRRLLDGSVGELGVADAANTHGFWHLGQFAKDFRNQFGVLPSDIAMSARRSFDRRTPSCN